MFKYMGHMHICNAPSVNNNYWVNVLIASILDEVDKLIKRIRR